MLSEHLYRFFSLCAVGIMAGCGGGGGDQPIASVITTPPPETMTGAADSLFASLTDDPGLRDIGYVIDTDSGQIHIFHDRESLNLFLVKQPATTEFFLPAGAEIWGADLASSEAVRLTYIHSDKSAIDADQFLQGKYLLWGRLWTSYPKFGTADYRLQGIWQCPSCAADTGTLDGQLIVHFEQLEANMIVSATSPDSPFLQAEGKWIVGADGLSPAGELSISQHDQDPAASDWQGTGGLFGPDGQEAGLLVHMDGENGPVTAAMIGRHNQK